MRRTIKFSIKSANTNKLKKLAQLRRVYLDAVNYYIKRLAKESLYILNNKEVQKLNSELSYSFKQCAYRQAEKIWKSWRRGYKKNSSLPKFKGSLILDQRFVKFEKSKNSFDYWVKISTLEKNKRVSIPLNTYGYANNYFQDWKLVNGCRLKKVGDNWTLYLTFEKETPAIKEEGREIGIDIGIKKLMTTSDRRYYGRKIEGLMDKIQRKEQKSKAFYRALKERNEYINHTAKQLPYQRLKTIVVENIKDIFRNSKKDRKLGRQQRSKFQRWCYSHLFERLKQLAEATGVHLLSVSPIHTSQRCSECDFVHSLNRKGEDFFCRKCGYKADGDWNASKNILQIYLAQEHTLPWKQKRVTIS